MNGEKGHDESHYRDIIMHSLIRSAETVDSQQHRITEERRERREDEKLFAVIIIACFVIMIMRRS